MTTPSFVFPLVDVQPTPIAVDSTQTRSAIQTLKRSFLLDTATDDSLTVIGGNYGIPRPTQTDDDEIFRKLIPVLAWQPKTIKFTTFMVLTAVFGSQADIETAGGRAWQIYEPNANEFVLEIPFSLITASNEHASYMHGINGYAAVSSGPTNTFTVAGDLTALSATTLVGKDIQVFFGGVWNSYTISTATYNAGTNSTQIVVNAATIPTGGGFFTISIPGDGVSSYAGDYLANGVFNGTFVADTSIPPTNVIFVRGDASQFLRVGDVVTLQFTTHTNTYTITTVGAFSSTTNFTSITLSTADIVGGSTGYIFRDIEEAGGISTPGVNVRVYLSGFGLLEVVTFYLDLLVRAAGIVMRLELI